MRYIALLRGINVGGKNPVSMKALKDAFIAHGFADVETYINSGNILFSCDVGDETELKTVCQDLIIQQFGLHIPVVVLSSDSFIRAIGRAPSWWGQDAQSSHNAIFVIPPVTAEELIEQVGEIRPEYEKVGHCGNVIFWSAPVKTFSRTRWSKLVGTSAYGSVTIRNANTARKLADKLANTEKYE